MRKNFRLLLFVAVAAVLLMESAASADGVINNVPYTINSPGYYFLGKNLTYSGNEIAIAVNADDVTIDLMGLSLTGPGNATARGIVIGGGLLKGRSNVEVRNGTVTGFSNTAIEEGDIALGRNHRVINIRAINNGTGILLSGKNHLIKNCLASNNQRDGLYMGSGLMIDNVCNSNGNYGIWMSPGPGNVMGNTAFNNGTHNFLLGSNILVDRNSAFGLSPNYSVGTDVLITANNAGTP